MPKGRKTRRKYIRRFRKSINQRRKKKKSRKYYRKKRGGLKFNKMTSKEIKKIFYKEYETEIGKKWVKELPTQWKKNRIKTGDAMVTFNLMSSNKLNDPIINLVRNTSYLLRQ